MFRKNREFLLIVAVFMLFLFTACSSSTDSGNKTEPETPSNTQTQPAVTPPTTTPPVTTPPVTTPEPPAEKSYVDGMYMVGTDIEPGLYQVKLTDTIMKMGYVERAKDVSMELDDIIANILITGDGYVAIKDTDKVVKVTGAKLTKVDYDTLAINIKTEIEDGIYLVNKDIKPGTYKVIVTDTTMKMGYVERATNVYMGLDDIIANQIFQGDGYVKILESDYAVRLQGVKLIFQE